MRKHEGKRTDRKRGEDNRTPSVNSLITLLINIQDILELRSTPIMPIIGLALSQRCIDHSPSSQMFENLAVMLSRT